MRKTLSFIYLMLFGGIIAIQAAIIELTVQADDNTSTCPSTPKTPTEVPVVDQTGNVITFKAGHDPYTLCIVNEDGLTVYSVSVPTSVLTVTLPSWITGDYEIRLLTGETYYFYGDITL